ncbi:MAG TPA: sigma-70 family RNA polymerase sigma factor [Leucothrix mucor]|nr:sigma-70 family RNA polymerase sigma factor [Leucothrix mucor]
MEFSKNNSALLQSVYPELKRLASIYMSRERAGHTLCPTALVNEAYLKLCSSQDIESKDKQHFLAICGRCLRQVLVEHSRVKNALKRGGDRTFMTLHEDACGDNKSSDLDIDIIALEESLKQLERLDAVQVRVVELRFFSGMTIEEIANVLDLSESTIKRKWTMAKAWLYKEIKK